MGKINLKDNKIMPELTQKPYTIKLFMPYDNPNTFKIINKMNWTGVGLDV